jgi:hypothetical protein
MGSKPVQCQPARMAMVHVFRKAEHTRVSPKVIFGELLTKQAMRKKNIIIYKKYIHT